MISDNASTYLSAAKEIEELVNSVKIHDTLKVQGHDMAVYPKACPLVWGLLGTSHRTD